MPYLGDTMSSWQVLHAPSRCHNVQCTMKIPPCLKAVSTKQVIIDAKKTFANQTKIIYSSYGRIPTILEKEIVSFHYK